MKPKPLLSPETAKKIQQAYDASRRMRDGIDHEEDPELQSASEELSEISTDLMMKLSSLGVTLEEVSGQPGEVWEERFNGGGKDVAEGIKDFERVQAEKEWRIVRYYLGWSEDTDFVAALDSILKSLDAAKEMFGLDEKAHGLVSGILDRVDEYYGTDLVLTLDDEQLDSLQDAHILRPGDVEELYRIVQFYGADTTVSNYLPSELPEAINSEEEFLTYLTNGTFRDELLVGAQKLAPVYQDIPVEDLVLGLEQVIVDKCSEVEFVEAPKTLQTVFSEGRLPLIHDLQRVVISLFESDESFDPETDELKDVVKVAILALKLMMKRIQQSQRYERSMSPADTDHSRFLLRKSGFMEALGITPETEEEDYDRLVSNGDQPKGLDQLVRENPVDPNDLARWKKMLMKSEESAPEEDYQKKEEEDNGLEDWPGWEN